MLYAAFGRDQVQLSPTPKHHHRWNFRDPADTPLRVEALQLLPSFLAAPATTRTPAVAALDAMVLDVFPPTCRDLWPRPAGQPAVDYGLQLLALLDAAAIAAARHADVGPVLSVMQYVIKEMGNPRGHLLQLPIARRLAAMAAAPWATTETAEIDVSPAEAAVDARAAAAADAMADLALQWLWEGAAYPADIKCDGCHLKH